MNKEQLEHFYGLQPESQGHNLALVVLCVAYLQMSRAAQSECRDLRYLILGMGFRVNGLRFEVQGVGFRVYRLGFRV